MIFCFLFLNQRQRAPILDLNSNLRHQKIQFRPNLCELNIFLRLSQLFEYISISESIQNILRGGRRLRDIPDHNSFTKAYKGVLQNHSQFGASKKSMTFTFGLML